MLRSCSLLGRRLALICSNVSFSSSSRIYDHSSSLLHTWRPPSLFTNHNRLPPEPPQQWGGQTVRWLAHKGKTKKKGEGKRAHQNKIRAMRKLNVNHRHTLILRECDELFKGIIEDARREKAAGGKWHPLERLVYHKKFRGWTKLRTIIGAMVNSKKRYLLKDDGERVYFNINLSHPKYVKQRADAIKDNPSLTSNLNQRYEMRSERQTENLQNVAALRKKYKGTTLPNFAPGTFRPSTDPLRMSSK